MTMVLYIGVFHHLLLACLVSSSLALSAEFESDVNILPQSPVVEIGKNFTATCSVVNTSEATAEDLEWFASSKAIPREQYTKINTSAVNVTITITSETPSWLICKINKSQRGSDSDYYGIEIHKGYPPEKPENLFCMAVQVDTQISKNITCFWDNRNHDTQEIETKTSLFFTSSDEIRNEEIKVDYRNNGTVTLDVFPHHMILKIWVESENKLGKVQSDVIETEADRFVKTNPPSNVNAISENHFPTSLLINWTQPIAKAYVKLIYHIRYCQHGSPTWSEIPLADTATESLSFRLQYLRPDTCYDTQVRCKMYREGFGYWSEWSNNATGRTPEDKPRSKPDLWRKIYNTEGGNKQTVHILCKDPVLSYGKIKRFDIKSFKDQQWEKVVVNRTESEQKSNRRIPIDLTQIEGPIIYVEVIAHNSVGESPKALLKILRNEHDVSSTVHDSEFPPVNNLTWLSQKGQLLIEWQPHNSSAGGPLPKYTLSEYVVEWVSVKDGQMDWQREPRNSSKTVIRGDLKNFTYYNISVYPLYFDRIGQPVTVAAYLEQGAPSEAPIVKVESIGRNEAVLVWNEIPQDKQRGFIVNHTLYYFSVNGSDKHVIPLPADTYTYHLKGLSSNTTYRAKVEAWTIQGSATSTEHMFNTAKYAPGQLKGIVVGVCLGFLFLLLVTTMLCFYKQDSIQNNFWPKIPNPENSRIGTWTPDFRLKNDTPKDNALVDVSVVEVDTLDGKSVFEEDKACLPLKKDKYLSEEHSSGIGDSSCMSSPRQSVSDSDEGGDLGETTASTVQYSSVVASQGYKGQNPGALLHAQQQQQQPPSFSRSESTQPLLDSEDGGDVLGTSGQSRHLSPGSGYRSSTFRLGSTNCAGSVPPETGEQESAVLLRFWPLDEACQQSRATDAAESPEFLDAVPVSHCMTKLDGYRPQ